MKKVLLLTDYSSDYSRSATRYREIFKGTRALDLLSDAFVLSGIIWRRWSCPVGKKWKVDAIIAQLKDVDVEKLNKLNIPIIIQNYKERADNICNITGDYFKTGEMAADFS